MSIEGALPPHPPPLEPNPSYAVQKIVCEATIEELNAAIAEQGVAAHRIITIMFAGGKYHIFYRTEGNTP